MTGAESAVPPTRGVIGLIASACTSCMLCVKECPTWCITLEHHVEEASAPDARRARRTNVLDAFAIDYGLCMYCGICVDVCPFDALAWRPAFDYGAPDRAGLVHGMDRLASWLD